MATEWEKRFRRIYEATADGPDATLRAVYEVLDSANAFGSVRVAHSAAAALDRVLEEARVARLSVVGHPLVSPDVPDVVEAEVVLVCYCREALKTPIREHVQAHIHVSDLRKAVESG